MFILAIDMTRDCSFIRSLAATNGVFNGHDAVYTEQKAAT
jgi:hypothetical protein